MGLLIEDDGQLSLASCSNNLSTTAEHARNKVLSFTLIWLLCKVIHHLAPLPQSDHSRAETESSAARDFVHLESQFDTWHQIISASFHPDGTFFTPVNGDQEPKGLFAREIWFSNDFCSTTMMYYHMARLLLLIHRPPGLLSEMFQNNVSASFDLIHTLRETKQKLQFHAAEVISIARGTPCDAVKLRAIQPLYIAGRCCTTVEDRKGLVEFLASIQDNLGIATGYRIKALLEEWEVTYGDFGMEERLTAEAQL